MNITMCKSGDFVFSLVFQLRVTENGSARAFFMFSFCRFRYYFLSLLVFGGAVSGAINKDKENAVKKSDKNKSIPKR